MLTVRYLRHHSPGTWDDFVDLVGSFEIHVGLGSMARFAKNSSSSNAASWQVKNPRVKSVILIKNLKSVVSSDLS